jgi:hypothetical protein
MYHKVRYLDTSKISAYVVNKITFLDLIVCVSFSADWHPRRVFDNKSRLHCESKYVFENRLCTVLHYVCFKNIKFLSIALV